MRKFFPSAHKLLFLKNLVKTRVQEEEKKMAEKAKMAAENGGSGESRPETAATRSIFRLLEGILVQGH